MIRFVTLGRIDLVGLDEEHADSVLRGPKRLGLLAYLVLARPGGYRRRDSLLPLLWPERDTSRARHALRNTLYELRQSLGEDTLPGRGRDEVGVAADRLRCDAVAFREALDAGDDARAIELYEGELLPGLHVNGAAPSFEKWLERERTRLQRDALEAARRLTEESVGEGDADGAVRWARRAASLDRYDEASLRQLMSLLARAGRRAEALRAYRDFVERVSSDLGFQPEAETRALAASIRSSSGGAPVDPGVPGSTEPAADTRGPASTPGEEREDRDESPAEAGDTHASASRGESDGSDSQRTERPPSPGIDPGFRRFGWLAAAVLAALAAGVVWLAVTSGEEGGTPEPGEPAATDPGVAERVAIFPFHVHGDEGSEESSFLSTGLASLLAADLDGTGNLRAVSPGALRLGGEGGGVTTEPGDASEVSRDLEAGLFLLGNAVMISEEVRLTAALYRIDSDPPLARASVEGERGQLFDLVDELAAELLTNRRPEEELPMVRQAARATTSLPALKAYLAGDEHFHAGRFGSATAAYREAIEADSGFALAHHRLSVTAEWMGDRETARGAGERAVRRAARLPPRQRRLLSAHLTSLRGDASEAERQYREIIATYPNDLEAWYQLGEILFHYAPAVGRSIGEAREAFSQVVTLSPDHVPSLVHLARIAAAEERTDDVSRLTDRVLTLVPGSPWAWESRALNVVAGRGGRGEEELVDGLRDATDRSVRMAAWSVSAFAQDLETGSRLARLLTASWRSPETRRVGREWTTELAVARGLWRQAGSTPVPPPDRGSAFQAHRGALLAALPFVELQDSTLTALRQRLRGEHEEPVRPGPDGAAPDSSGLDELLPRLRLFAAGLLFSRAGDFQRALARASALDTDLPASGDVPLANDLGRIVRAHVTWKSGRPDSALRILGEETVRTRSSLMFGRDYVQPYERYLRARLLEAVGRTDEALRWYSSFQHQHVHHLVYLAPTHLRRARILEATDDSAQALPHYRSLLELWEDPAPEFTSLRAAAERRVRRLNAGR